MKRGEGEAGRPVATLLDARVMFEWFQFDPVWTGWIGCRETVSMPGISPLWCWVLVLGGCIGN